MKKLPILLFISIALFSCGDINSSINEAAQEQMNDISNQVAKDAEKQYNIAVQGGDKMDIYTQASLVAAAYLQANDSINYKKWKDIEKKHAKEIGI